MASGDVLLDVAGLALKLGNTQILEGVTFQVKDIVRPGVITGQVVALLGPSGVGKTRLLRLIAGLDEPDRGSIKGFGSAKVDPGKVGVVFQSYPLLAHRTVLSNLVMAGVANGQPKAEAQKHALSLLERFGLAARAHFYPAQISGGQRQRAAIAQQLMRRPPLLLMDEPFSGLDPAALEDVIKLLVEVANMHELNTVIIVTHDIRSAMVVADTVLMLGRERAADNQPKGGAHIRKSYDLAAMGLAWRPDVQADPRFVTLEAELKGEFRRL